MTKSKRSPLRPWTIKPAQKAKAAHPKPEPRKQPIRATKAARQPVPPAKPAAQLPTIADARLSRPSKKAAITTLLHRPEGVTLADLITATGWLAHSVRAALTGLRRDGHTIARSLDAVGITRYRIIGCA